MRERLRIVETIKIDTPESHYSREPKRPRGDDPEPGFLVQMFILAVGFLVYVFVCEFFFG